VGRKKREDVPKASRLTWSPERGGRTRQKVADKWVPKYAFSPYTAKAGKDYTWYVDIEMEKEAESPQGKGKAPVKFKNITMEVWYGTYNSFIEGLDSGEVMEKMAAQVSEYGGGSVLDYGFWRSREKVPFIRSEED